MVVEEGSCLLEEFELLRECLGAVKDPRHARGVVHPLVGVLSLTVLALMAGAHSLSDTARWGSLYPEVLAALALRRRPSVTTLGRLLRLVSVREVRAALLGFAGQLNKERGQEDALGVVAAGGKALRAAWEDRRQWHVRHLFAHQAAPCLDQVAVREHTDEVRATKEWLEEVVGQVPGLAVLPGRGPRSSWHLGGDIGASRIGCFMSKMTASGKTGMCCALIGPQAWSVCYEQRPLASYEDRATCGRIKILSLLGPRPPLPIHSPF